MKSAMFSMVSDTVTTQLQDAAETTTGAIPAGTPTPLRTQRTVAPSWWRLATAAVAGGPHLLFNT